MARTEDFFSALNIDGSQPFNGMTPDKALLSASLDLDVEQMTEIEFVMDDPGYVYFNSFGTKGPIGKDATYADLKLRVASYTLGPGSTGNGGITLRLRPRGVEQSRAIRGALTRQGISPSQFVIDGARSAGMTAITQDSPVRPSISRDVAGIDGNQQSERDDKNEWTTLQRLAAEEGFLCFERSNTLIFGSPQWLFEKQPTHVFSYGPGSPFKQNWMLERPEYTSSTTRDSADEIQFKVPTDSSGIILPGQNASLVGLPKFFKEKLLITNVNYPLIGPGEMSITARSPWVIEKQKTPEQIAAENAARNAASSNGGGSGAVNMGPGGNGNKDFYAREIIAAAKERGLGPDGARNGIATALVESELRMYANNAVPASLKFPHDAVGSDHDSVGLFQQRQAGWGTLEQRMNPRASAGLFFNKMMTFNWRAMDPGAACQKVQVSAYPGKYAQRMGEASGYVQRLGY